MTYTTQCPDCQTRFKVNDAQLAVAGGLVRCGRCSHVFNATLHLVEQPEPPRLDEEAPAPQPETPHAHLPEHRTPAEELDDFELEVPDFDPEAARAEAEAERLAAERTDEMAEEKLPPPSDDSAAPTPEDIDAFQRALSDALHTPAVPHHDRSPDAPIGDPFAEPVSTFVPPPSHEADTRSEEDDEDETPAIFDTRRTAAKPAAMSENEPFAEPFTPARDEPALSFATAMDPVDTPTTGRAWWKTTLLVAASVVGLTLLAGQLVYLNRTRIGAEVPELRPALETACKAFGCTVALPTDLQYIRTEWSDCPQLPDHPNVLQLQAKVRNRAPYPQAWPMMELTLKDGDDQVLVRKVFTPKEYLKADDFKLGRFNANTEARVDILFDAGPIRPRGYSIYWFYP
ncbi:DUF3426 domain-containing protein [Paludibacterium paludis]|uniref:Zinc finger/thioredoxin putative domain-containing protein n=1 Tax=Paludibacterium paludis TaxID=1225769 RepID=A0A918U6W7_9NEIS|nr:DUF3426 domain-containing protein [Paludibacterium paludis]GGY02042.1 hypothetical protein GCM10011289_00120 [Paludibacterium paludis]